MAGWIGFVVRRGGFLPLLLPRRQKKTTDFTDETDTGGLLKGHGSYVIR